MKIISLFSNIGVSDVLLTDKVAVAVEIDPTRARVFKNLYPHTDVVNGDLTDDNVAHTITNKAKDAFLLVATPPCQGFSTLNAKKKDDPRNKLIFRTFDLVNTIKPPYFLVENVPQMVKAFENNAIPELLPDYSFNFKVLDAADFGVPQHRKRAIILFTRDGHKPWVFPEVKTRHTTLREAIGYLPPLESGEKSDISWHFAQKHSHNHVLWMKHTPTGQSAHNNKVFYPSVIENGVKRKIKGFANTYKRMSWDEPATTLIAGSHMISSCNTVHPGNFKDGYYDNARTLSVLEAMIVMGLKPNWTLPDFLSYKQAINFLGEGFCPQILKTLVDQL